MHELGLPALLVTKHENVLYLSGFSGSAGALIVSQDRLQLITDFRYELQVTQEAPTWEFILAQQTLDVSVRQVLTDSGYREVGFEAGDLTLARYYHLGGEERDAPYLLQPTNDVVEQLRIVKDADELVAIREAVRITDAAYAHVLSLARPGVTEWDLALEAEWFMRKHGAESTAFPSIIAAGAHSALCHAQPGARALQVGDLVIVDMGARYARYCGDMTRTFAVAEASPTMREIYRVCAEAQMAGVERITAGMSGVAADHVVREVIEAAGYGAYFGHGTGHGVGLEVHEAPRVSRTAEAVLPVGATVTIEPGIYLPDIGGVRIEDLVVVHEAGVEILTAAPKPKELPIVE